MIKYLLFHCVVFFLGVYSGGGGEHEGEARQGPNGPISSYSHASRFCLITPALPRTARPGAAVVTVTQICLQGDGRESSTTPSLDRQRQEDFRLLPKPNDWTNVFDKPSYTPSSSGSLNSVSLKPPLELRTLDFNRTFPLSRWIVSAVFGWHRRSGPAFCFGATCLAQRREARFRAGVRC